MPYPMKTNKPARFDEGAEPAESVGFGREPVPVSPADAAPVPVPPVPPTEDPVPVRRRRGYNERLERDPRYRVRDSGRSFRHYQEVRHA